MPTVNIPSGVRFALYILASFGSVLVAYAFSKGYIGESETACWAGLVAVVNGIAAANTNLSGSVPVLIDNAVGEVADEDAAAELEAGVTDQRVIMWLFVVAVVITVVLLLGL